MQHAHLFDDEFMSPVWPSGRLPAADSLIQTLGKLWFATWMASCLLVGKKDILQHSLEAIARSENTRCFFLLGKTTHNQFHWKPISHELLDEKSQDQMYVRLNG